jgi:hypothetical protein
MKKVLLSSVFFLSKKIKRKENKKNNKKYFHILAFPKNICLGIKIQNKKESFYFALASK